MNPVDPTITDQTGTEPLETTLEEGLKASEPVNTTLDPVPLESIETASDAPMDKASSENPKTAPDTPVTDLNKSKKLNSEVIDKLQKRIAALNPLLEDNERLKLSRIVQEVNMAYYQSWSAEANKTFRL